MKLLKKQAVVKELNIIQLEQQKSQLPLLILAKNLKAILYRVTKGT